MLNIFLFKKGENIAMGKNTQFDVGLSIQITHASGLWM